MLILLISDPTTPMEGDVFRVLHGGNPQTPTVILDTGDKGRVVRVLSDIRSRIMEEDQYNENKEGFSEDVMRHKVIPETVQSFLNSDGGHLHLGVKDTGKSPRDRLVGLDSDFQQIKGFEEMTTDKLCDELARKIIDAVNKHLVSSVQLGPLVDVRFEYIEGVYIADIRIKRSPEPWFFKNRKETSNFCIRQGGGKKWIDTYEEFYNYTKEHFVKK